jgi:ketosteroid isomerase-like protein
MAAAAVRRHIMVRMLRYLACFFAIAVVALCAPEDEIRTADQRWAAAVKGGDTAVLERMYTSGLIYAHATGKVEDKSQYIERLKSGKQKYSDVVIESTKIVAYGDSAVSHSIVRTIGTNDNGPFNDHVMMMHVWVKQRGEWRLAAHQTTKIP